MNDSSKSLSITLLLLLTQLHHTEKCFHNKTEIHKMYDNLIESIALSNFPDKRKIDFFVHFLAYLQFLENWYGPHFVRPNVLVVILKILKCRGKKIWVFGWNIYC